MKKVRNTLFLWKEFVQYGVILANEEGTCQSYI